MYNIPNNKEELLQRWYKRLREMQFSHYEAAKPLGSRNLWLGIPVVVLTTFVGTSVFASLQKEIHPTLKIIVGCVSVLAAVLASLQTFLKYSEKAEQHRATAARAGAIRREIEQLLACGEIATLSEERLNSLRDRIDKVGENAPSVSESVWAKTRTVMGEEDKH